MSFGSDMVSGMFFLFVDLKQIYCQIFFQQGWIYSESAENCNLESTVMASHVQVPAQQGK